MSGEIIRAVNYSRDSSKHTWERIEGESRQSVRRILPIQRSRRRSHVAKSSGKVGKSEQLMQRWGKNFNWHNRALDFDEHSDSELQRKLLAHRVRVRQRALDIADKIDQKLVEAVDALKVTKVVKTEGKPDEMQLQVSPAEIARLFEVSQKNQSAILGDGSEDRVAAIHVHFDAYNEEYDYEQPAAMAETRRKALEAQQALSE